MPRDNSIRIGLLWHSVRSGNLGVGALTVSNLLLLREACAELGLAPSFVIMGGREPGAAYVAGPDIEVRDIDRRFLLDRSEYWSVLKSLDCVIDIGGGDSLSDIYGSLALGLQLLPKFMALMQGRPLLLSPQTVGPFNRRSSRVPAAYVLKRADAVLARDPTSLRYARQLTRKCNAQLSVDVAFTLPFERRERHDAGVIQVGINISGLLFSAESDRRFGLGIRYPELMRDLLTRLTARPDVRVKLMTHVIIPKQPIDDDGRAADILAAEFPTAERVPDFASPSDAKSYISGLDLMIGARMHACIAAFSSGVPVVPIAYSRKFDGLFKGVLGYEHGVPVAGWSNDQALDYLVGAVDRREELRRDLAPGLQRAEEKLDVYRNELRRFLQHAIAARMH